MLITLVNVITVHSVGNLEKKYIFSIYRRELLSPSRQPVIYRR